VVARFEDVHHRCAAQERRHRVEATAERFADDQCVGFDAVPLVGEQLAGPAQARLDLVADQQDVVLFTDLGSFLHVAGRWDVDASFALHRFDHERASALGDRLGQRLVVTERYDLKTGRERPKTVAVLLFRREADDGGRTAVEVVRADDDLAPIARDALDRLAPFARRLDRRLDRLGAGVHRQNLGKPGQLTDLLAERRQLVVAKRAAGQRDSCSPRSDPRLRCTRRSSSVPPARAPAGDGRSAVAASGYHAPVAR